jgi:hypothetical protein
MTKMTKHKKLEGWHRVTESGGRKGLEKTWNVSFHNISCGIEFSEVRKRLNEIEKDHGDKFTKFKIESVDENDYDGIITTTHVYGWRFETDEEFADRIQQIKDREEYNLAREQSEFRRLSEKFKT